MGEDSIISTLMMIFFKTLNLMNPLDINHTEEEMDSNSHLVEMVLMISLMTTMMTTTMMIFLEGSVLEKDLVVDLEISLKKDIRKEMEMASMRRDMQSSGGVVLQVVVVLSHIHFFLSTSSSTYKTLYRTWSRDLPTLNLIPGTLCIYQK